MKGLDGTFTKEQIEEAFGAWWIAAAHKQLPLFPDHACLGVVAITGPDEKAHFFRARSLMFGQASAVYAFIRFSRAIAAIASSLLDLIVVELFDDFSQIEASCTGDSAKVRLKS